MIRYLDQHEGCDFAKIKAQFPDVAVDKLMEEYIKAGLILRENKRYYLNLPMLESLDSLELDQRDFVSEDSPVYQALLEQSFETELRNQTNAAILVEKTDFARTEMTLSNYFYKVKHQYPLTEKNSRSFTTFWEMLILSMLLKYMTTFLLKFLKKTSLYRNAVISLWIVWSS